VAITTTGLADGATPAPFLILLLLLLLPFYLLLLLLLLLLFYKLLLLLLCSCFYVYSCGCARGTFVFYATLQFDNWFKLVS
jgi:hypothetical protein